MVIRYMMYRIDVYGHFILLTNGVLKMKKSAIILASVVALSGLFIAPVAMAQPANVKVSLDCPDIGSKGSENVTNFGSYLSGSGTERVNGALQAPPVFSGLVQAGMNIPTDLVAGGYHQSGTSYDPNSGNVSCKYSSNISGFSAFTLVYHINNGIGGTVASSSSDEIRIKLEVGYRA